MIFIGMRISLYHGTSLLDKGILFFSRGGFTHAAIYLDDDRVVEAYPFKGIRIRNSLTESLKHDCSIEVYHVPTSATQDEIIKEFLAKQVGKGYDYWSIIGFVIYATHEGRKSYGRWFCSELVFSAFRQAGINLLERVEAWKVSPTILSFNTVMKPVEVIQFKVRTAKKLAM